ncbi:MAG: hypothetical protein C3F06_05620 [Candidatus Methanoperedenaceae archaeon]|nr:MAG: hypothetical protein C3F06_05620 [Candidatus Methanoperedenaceae archaeon]
MVFGLEVASKVFINICNVELGKPDVLPNISQGVTKAQRVEDMIKSECRSVTNRIEVLAST